MDDRLMAEEKSAGLETELKVFTSRIIDERIADGDIDPATMTFSEMELLGHEIGQRVARMLGGQMAGRQIEMLWSDDYNCPTCGLECEAVKKARAVQTIDGTAEIVEVKSFCPKCRRNFFPCASRQRSQ